MKSKLLVTVISPFYPGKWPEAQNISGKRKNK